MTRFLGRVGASAGQGEVAALRAALGAGAATADARSGRGGTLVLDRTAEPCDVWNDDTTFAVVQGEPRVARNPAFAAAVRELGLARACAAQYTDAGPAFLDALDGPFALAVYVGDDDRALLAIDKIGVCSLYYTAVGKALSFANKLGPLGHLVKRDIDQQSVYDYLYYHHIPTPATIYKGVRRLLPGAYVERRRGALRLDRYWSIRFEREDDAIDFGAEKRAFVEIVRSAVRRELDTSREIGCFLSGGTDSSTLAGMLGAVGGRAARTYSIGFEQQGFDEMEYARIAVRHFGTRQREYYLQPADIVSFAPRIADIYGQPFGNSSAVPTYYCAQMARSDGVERMIAGDGGDELFGGNKRYATQQLFEYYSEVPAPLRRYVLEPLAFRAPGAAAIMPLRKLRRYIEQAVEPMPGRMQSYNYLDRFGHEAIFEPEFVRQVDTTAPARELAEVYAQANARKMLNKMMALDLKITLTDTDLPKVVETCAAAGVGVAFPFLAQEVVDFAARLPAHQKVSRLRLRYFFKEALRDFLPIEIINKKKHGFGMPFGDWLLAAGPLRDLAFDSMSGLKARGIVRSSFVDDLCNVRLREHANYYGGFMWVLMILELWLQWNARQGKALSAAET